MDNRRPGLKPRIPAEESDAPLVVQEMLADAALAEVDASAEEAITEAVRTDAAMVVPETVDEQSARWAAELHEHIQVEDERMQVTASLREGLAAVGEDEHRVLAATIPDLIGTDIPEQQATRTELFADKVNGGFYGVRETGDGPIVSYEEVNGMDHESNMEVPNGVEPWLKEQLAVEAVTEVVSSEARVEKKSQTQWEAKKQARLQRMRERRAAMREEARTESVKRVDAMMDRFAAEDAAAAEQARKEESEQRYLENKAQAERAVAEKLRVEAWEAQQALLLAQQETERRAAALGIKTPKGGLKVHAQLAMAGLVAAGLALVFMPERDPGGPSRDQVTASSSPEPELPQAGAGPENTVPVAVGPQRQIDQIERTYEDAPTDVFENSGSVVQELPQQPVQQVERVRTVQEVPQQPEQMNSVFEQEPPKVENARVSPQQGERTIAEGIGEPRVDQQGASMEEGAMEELVEDMGKQRSVSVGSITIKRSLFGKWKVQHDDVKGWVALDDTVAAQLIDTYQLDVAKGFGSSALYGMTPEQFMDMVPDSSRTKRRWNRKNKRKNQ